MTITSAFNSALSGLNATRAASALVSENIANALTPGYARRSLALAASADTTPGVRIGGVVRHADPVLIANRRATESSYGFTANRQEFFARLSGLTGIPGEAGSLSDRLAAFDSSLVQAASRPESQLRLDNVAVAAGDLVSSITKASDGLADLRRAADREISVQVDALNTALGQVEDLNTRIVALTANGADASGIKDQRRVLIDEINQIVPVKVIERPKGQVSLFSDGGLILLDGSAAEVSFSQTPNLMPHMTLDNGLLSGLSVNGQPIRVGATGGMRGGSLAAQFEIRDVHAVAAQADLDSFARNLVERFQSPAVDPTLGPGDPGLFTDAGAAFDPLDEVGLAGRLQLNALVDPGEAGETWRLRDGFGAAAPGDAGEAGLLRAYSATLENRTTVSSGTLAVNQVSASELAASLVSGFATLQANEDRALSFATASLTEMSRQELADGVDTDAELQTLLIVEQAYEANARVLQTLDELMETLLRL